jgi:hypothetical protein
VFLHVEARNDEIPRQDRFDFGSLDKPIEALAPPSPGSFEEQKDLLVLSGGLRLGFGQYALGGGRT